MPSLTNWLPICYTMPEWQNFLFSFLNVFRINGPSTKKGKEVHFKTI